MSVIEDPFEVEAEATDPGSSLDARMETRSSQIELEQTEWFPVPGYDDIVEVELRALGWKTRSAIGHRNERVRNPGDRELYTMADELLQATAGFRQVWPETDTEPTRPPQPITDDWVRLARRRSTCPADPTARQALLFIVGDKRIAFLYADWMEWAKSVRPDVDEEVKRDFSRTG